VELLWLLIGAGSVITGALAFRNYPGWLAIATTASLCSLALCLLGWPEARIGVAVDLLILLALLTGAKTERLAR
jgi:hypothetical protein